MPVQVNHADPSDHHLTATHFKGEVQLRYVRMPASIMGTTPESLIQYRQLAPHTRKSERGQVVLEWTTWKWLNTVDFEPSMGWPDGKQHQHHYATHEEMRNSIPERVWRLAGFRERIAQREAIIDVPYWMDFDEFKAVADEAGCYTSKRATHFLGVNTRPHRFIGIDGARNPDGTPVVFK